MGALLSGNASLATANTAAAMQRSATDRQCSKCGRKSALCKPPSVDGVNRVIYCRWDKLCGYSPGLADRRRIGRRATNHVTLVGRPSGPTSVDT
jgi:hypothetical protein